MKQKIYNLKQVQELTIRNYIDYDNFGNYNVTYGNYSGFGSINNFSYEHDSAGGFTSIDSIGDINSSGDYYSNDKIGRGVSKWYT